MKIDSVDELKVAFQEWRRKKGYVRERVPVELMVRASRAAGVYGVGVVARATRVERSRLRGAGQAPQGRKRPVPGGVVPSFSQVELWSPRERERPYAEVETPTGLKVRLFAATPETVGLLSTLCGAGGGR